MSGSEPSRDKSVRLADQVGQLIGFIGANVDKEVLLRGKLVHGGKDIRWRTPQLGVEVKMVLNVFEQGDLAAVVRFDNVFVI